MCKKLILVFLFLPSLIFAQYQRPGSTSAQFLKIGVSPRAVGMGNAYISVVKGAEATYYNPAALAWMRQTDVTFNHTEWFAGLNLEFAAISQPFGRVSTFGVSFTALYTDEMKVRTPLQPDGTGETFYAGAYRVGLSYSRFLTDRVTLGGTLNYTHLSLFSGFSANAISGDIGILYITHFRDFSFGVKIANFGSEVKFVNESYPLPGNFTFGLSMNVIDGDEQKLLVSFSAEKPNDGEPLGQLGVEWNWGNVFFVRAGYNLNHDVASYSFGGGLQSDLRGLNLRLDYGYSDFSLLGGAHRFGIGFTL